MVIPLVISYVNKHNRASKNLERSLQKYNYKYKFLGINDVWEGFITTKIKTVLRYLYTINDEIICVVDGYDMIASGYPDELYKKYKSQKVPIIYGGEKFCFSYNGTPVEKYKNISLWKTRKFANGGFCIGERNALISLYEWIVREGGKRNIDDDQKILGMYINQHPDRVNIDIYQEIVFNTITTIDCNSFTMKNDRVFIKPFKTFPCFVHFPSSSSDEHDRYNTYGRKILKKEFRSLIPTKTSFHILANIPYYTIAVVLFIIILSQLFPFKYVMLTFLSVLLIVIKLKVSAVG